MNACERLAAVCFRAAEVIERADVPMRDRVDAYTIAGHLDALGWILSDLADVQYSAELERVA